MKIIIASNGKKTIRMSKSEWIEIGKTAGWDKKPLKNPSLFENGDNSVRRSIKVTFDDGDIIHTSINGTKEEIQDYYLNNDFIKSDEKTTHRGVKVEFLDEKNNYWCAMCGRKSNGPNELCNKCTSERMDSTDEREKFGGPEL